NTPAAPSVGPTFTKVLGDLQLTWRTTDGALVQAAWSKDGTRFFPEKAEDKNGKTIALPFSGLGGTFEPKFTGDPAADGQSVTFTSAAGDKLVYRLPGQGHVLEVEWTPAGNTPLALVRMPSDEKQVHSLNRVFTLDESRINAVPWSKMLSDPWIGKRKELPPATAKLGLDAGIDSMQSIQRSHYFCAIWELGAPATRDAGRGYSATGATKARLYLGPKQADQLAAFGQPYTQVLDFGFFGLVAKGMFWILQSLHRLIPNWGWTIVVFSMLLRLALWPLNTKTTLQMLRMKDLEPYQKEIQAKYAKFGNDMTKKAEMQKELMAFYKKNGHNPMGGCLPMLLQMPVFFALWSMLNAVFELRHSPFLGWIHDLSAKDPFFIFPVLLGASMIAQQAMTPATGDPAQRKMMMFMMPAMMIFFFSSTPSGLCLYYLMFNLIGMGQAWWLKHSYKPQPVVI
ncbi:MAG TPA: YidC/Oxa1 family insertase periplasmic-domain containing protein, partial [Holophaga sp.]|nr:YidC/Oxa1 family insertase periplasmic-domain containing protein [Holophaga sp.]